MEKDLDINVIKATQSSLGKYIKRPPLSDKLLKKPPFRFLHDIVTTVLKTTGFFDGLFEDNELISDNVKDRESKITFLNKVITVLATTTGKDLAVKPSKIVAGQEPDKTNELLQCLAQALDSKLSSAEAVKKYKENDKIIEKHEKGEKKLKGDNTEIAKKTEKVDTKLASRSNEKLTRTKRDDNSLTRNDKERNSTVKTKHTKSDNKSVSSGVKKNVTTKKQTVIKKTPDTIKNETTTLEPEGKNKLNAIDNEKEEEDISKISENKNYASIIDETQQRGHVSDDIKKQDIIDINNFNEQPIVDKLIITEKSNDELVNSEQSSSINNSNKLNVETNPPDNIHETYDVIREQHVNKKSSIDNITTETSEKENADKITQVRNEAVNRSAVRPPSVRPSSSRPGAPRLRERHEDIYPTTDNLVVGKVNIIIENSPNDEDEDTSLLVIENEKKSEHSNIETESTQFVSNQHGLLVQQILDSQKEFAQITSGKTEIEWEFDSQKAKEASTQEIELMRYNIEALSRISNPLGKLLDHIQEDVEVMRQELLQWTEQYEQAAKEFAKQKTVNEESLLPLLSKQKQLDVDIEDKRDKINDLKIVIHRNTLRINSLLASGHVQ